MALTEQAYNRAAAAEAAERNGRPHLTDARKEANATYQRRRARTAVDTLLEIDPEHYDEHTRRVLIETLPRLAEAGASTLELPEQLQAAWCDYANDVGPCTLPEGHAGDHDPDPYADERERWEAEHAESPNDHPFRGGCGVDSCPACHPDDEITLAAPAPCPQHGYTCRFGHDHSTPDNADACSMHDNGDYRA